MERGAPWRRNVQGEDSAPSYQRQDFGGRRITAPPEYPTEVLEGISSELSVPTGVMSEVIPTEVSAFVNRDKLPVEEGISPGEWNLAWQRDEELTFSDRFTHHRPESPGPHHRAVQELLGIPDFQDSNVAEEGKSRPFSRLPRQEYVQWRSDGFKQNRKRRDAGLDDDCFSSSGSK